VWDGEEEVAVVNSGFEPRGELAEFVEGCDEVVEVDGLDDEVFGELHPSAVDAVYSAMEGDVVVESYTNVAMPLVDLSPDVVLGVEPFRLHVFEPEGFMKACDFLRGRYRDRGRFEVRMENVLELESPELSLDLPALDEVFREEIEGAYFPVFEQFV